jgi:hypothetical protein
LYTALLLRFTRRRVIKAGEDEASLWYLFIHPVFSNGFGRS